VALRALGSDKDDDDATVTLTLPAASETLPDTPDVITGGVTTGNVHIPKPPSRAPSLG
jgi:hypothetical protein